MKTKIIIVGGFLGAGKTTLLWEAAARLLRKGKIVGLITNDQAADLVDTSFLEHSEGHVREVSGSCFCCNYNGFTEAIAYLAEVKKADVILAEPVGSCTDLSATIFQALKEQFGEKYSIAPLSVLADPKRLDLILNHKEAGDLHESAVYIIKKQLEEADIIVINKMDLYPIKYMESLTKMAEKQWPEAKIMVSGSKSTTKIDDWLEVVHREIPAGTHLADMDYNIYAEGEAVLGWLNANVEFFSETQDWNLFAEKLLVSLGRRFDQIHAAVGHIKLLLDSQGKYIMGNITGNGDSLLLREKAGNGKTAVMTLNARAQMDPDNLKQIIQEEIAKACVPGISFTVKSVHCLSPGRPNPTFRYNRVV